MKSLKEAEPVVVLDEGYCALERVCDITEAVRIQPEDWPPYADQAWTTIELANEISSLQAIVVAEDRLRLERRA